LLHSDDPHARCGKPTNVRKDLLPGMWVDKYHAIMIVIIIAK